jgi:organic hydroperoxide reductase OsmC/OhrA
MASRPRVFEFAVSLDDAWVGSSDRGGPNLPNVAHEWTPEHLVLAGLARCSLTSLSFHAKRLGIELRSHADARGSVTRRESDGRFAFAEIVVEAYVDLLGAVTPEGLSKLLADAERDCFVGASLSAKPTYRWIVDGEEIG